MPDLGIWEILIIAVVIMLLFGFKRLPEASRSIGRSMRIFKAETKGLRDGGDDTPQGATEAKSADFTQTPDDAPSPLPARSATVEEQRLEAQRFLAATEDHAGSGRTPADPEPVTRSTPGQSPIRKY